MSGAKNTAQESFIDPQEVLLPLLHIKLGQMKQFVKALQIMETVSSIFAVNSFVLQKKNLKEALSVGSTHTGKIQRI
jgi:hypothetical protein